MKVLFITLLLFSLTSCCLLIKCDEDSNSTNISSELEEIIGKARSSSCRYTRYGIDECKEFKENGMMIPIYPTLTFDPFSLEGFKLSIHKSISSANRIYSRTKIQLSDICELSGFNRVYKNFVDGTNSFSSFLKQDYATYFGSSLGISHECGIRAENYILLSSESSLNEWDDNFISALKLLPNEYNETIYSQFFNGYSPFIAIGSYGASFIRTYSKSENLGVVRFKAFDIVSGGNKSLFDISDTKLWIESILSNPTMVDFKIERMSQWINRLVSSEVMDNIIRKENSLISQRPDSSFFEQVKKDNLPCEYQKLSLINEYFDEGSQSSSKWRFLRSYHYGNNYIAGAVKALARHNGYEINNYVSKRRNVRPLAVLSSTSQGPFTKPLYGIVIFKVGDFIMTEALPTDVNTEVNGQYDILGYCSPVKYPGMSPLNRFVYSTGIGHYLAFSNSIQGEGLDFERILCYAYPDTMTNGFIENSVTVANVCVEK